MGGNTSVTNSSGKIPEALAALDDSVHNADMGVIRRRFGLHVTDPLPRCPARSAMKLRKLLITFNHTKATCGSSGM